MLQEGQKAGYGPPHPGICPRRGGAPWPRGSRPFKGHRINTECSLPRQRRMCFSQTPSRSFVPPLGDQKRVPALRREFQLCIPNKSSHEKANPTPKERPSNTTFRFLKLRGEIGKPTVLASWEVGKASG